MQAPTQTHIMQYVRACSDVIHLFSYPKLYASYVHAPTWIILASCRIVPGGLFVDATSPLSSKGFQICYGQFQVTS